MLARPLLAILTALGGGADVVTQRDQVDAMIDLDGLALLDDSTWHIVTTWNREGFNADGDHYHGIVDERTVVLAEFEGPGCVTRFRAGTMKGALRILVDGEPVVDTSGFELFTSGAFPFVPPLTSRTARLNFLSFLPMPFQESFRVEATADADEEKAHPRFFQATARRFPAGARVEPFSLDWDQDARRSLERAIQAWRAPSAFEPTTTGRSERAARTVAVPPGAERELAGLDGAGVIRELRLRVASRDFFVRRTARLRIYWDGGDLAAVDAPLGDFFGSAVGGLQHHTLPMGMEPDGTFYCRFRMPYRKGARIVLANGGAHSIDAALALEYAPRDDLPPEAGYFHARWRAQLTSDLLEEPNLAGAKNYFIAASKGKGRYLGTHLEIFHYEPGWWGEGDPLLWIDAPATTWPPTFHGTGTEEYFNGGWRGFNALPVATFVPLSDGQVGRDALPWNEPAQDRGRDFRGDRSTGRTVVNSWHLSDFPIFQESFHFTIEHGSNNRREDLFATTAYWYLDRPSAVWDEPGVPAGEELFARAHPTLEEISRRHTGEDTARTTLLLLAGFGHHRDPALRPAVRELLGRPELEALADLPAYLYLASELED